MLDDFGRNFLRLTLEIDKHIDGYVDACFGPPAIKAEVEAGDKQPVAALQAQLTQLQASIPAGDEQRAAYLKATLRAVDCTLRMLAGESFDYLDEVNRLYDIAPGPIDEDVFTAAHNELDTLLPGPGSIADRLEARRKRYELSSEKLLPLLELARDETRQRTVKLFDLVAGEGVELTLVDNQPWGAYNWYLGKARSLIEFNTDVPVSLLRIADMFAHEVYPGHHTEGQLKETLLYNDKGYAEEAVKLLHSPSAVIAEAIATTALEIIFPDGSHYDWTATVLAPAAGVDAEPPEQMQRIAGAQDKLRYARTNAAIFYNSGQMDEAQTIDYLQTHALHSPRIAGQAFKFLSNPLFRSYVFTYTIGYDLIEQAADGGDKLPVFRRLLTEQVLPSQLG